MFSRLGRGLVLLLAVTIFVFSVNHSGRGFADTNNTATDWLADSTPALSKVADLPDNKQPQLGNSTCYDVGYYNSAGTYTRSCANDTGIGTLTNSWLLAGPMHQYQVVGPGGHSSVSVLPGTNYAMTVTSASTRGVYIGIYYSLNRGDLEQQWISDGMFARMRYVITKSPDQWLKKPSGSSLAINPGVMGLSGNNKWMVVGVPGYGVVRINLDTEEVLPFASSLEASWFLGNAGADVAISNDGRYVAMSVFSTNSSNPAANLKVYDLSTCSSTFDEFRYNNKACKSHDIWNGYSSTATGKESGIHGMFTNAKIIGNLSFADDGNLAFTIEHNWHDASHYSVGRYVLTTAGSALHKLGLLGLGDSFISGEGAFNYVDGTDTTLNKCHLSRSSYPYILGREVAGSYESVACSGATTDDITRGGRDYKGQVTDNIKQGDRDQDAILAALTPGFLNQNKFTQKYLPSSILLSIGGNDIGFADIVKKCVTNPDDDAPCYGSYEDRLELATLIASKYTALYKTYQQIMDASPGARLYVVGYPEIVKPYGDCGENVHLNPAETEFAQQIVTYLNDVIEQAAKKAGAFYVDDHSALYGERLCEGSGDFIAVNGLTAGMDDGLSLFGKKKLYFLGHESYHPNAHGYELMATKIASKTLGLSSPMPAANPELTMPMPDDSNPLLQGMPHTGRKVYTLVPDPQMAADVLLKSQSANVTVDGLQANTQPGGSYSAVLHSDPIDLGTVKADASGNINADVTIPDGVNPGFHTLHLYGKSFDGEDVDIQKEVYVAASPEDYDGDGIANGQEKCVLAEPSNQDYDEDGIDDACDPEITEPPVLVATTTSDPTSPQKAVSVATTTQTASTAQLPTATVNSPVAADTMPATVAKLAKPNVLGIMTAKPQATVPTRISASDITSISNGKLLVASMLLLGIIAAIVAIVRRRV